MNVEVSGHNLESSTDLKIPYTDQFQTTFAQGGGGGGKIVIRGDCE